MYRLDHFPLYFWFPKYHLEAYKGNRAFSDLNCGEEDSISPGTLIFPAKKGYLGIYTLNIPPDIL